MFTVDIDDTLIKSEKIECSCGHVTYINPQPIQKEINIVNMLYREGAIIILHTGRNWDKYVSTKNMVERFGIKHHELVMGKPQGLPVDHDAITSLSNKYKNKGGISWIQKK